MATRVDPRAFLELIQSKGGYDPAGALPVDSQIAKQRIMDVRDRQDDRMGFYDTPVAGGEFAPIVGLLRGISKRNQEKLNDEELSSVYDEFRSVEERRMQAEAQKEAQKAADAEALRQRQRLESREDQQWTWQNKPPAELTPKDLLQMQATQAQIANIMSQMQGRQETTTIKREKADREAAEADAMKKQKAQTNEMLVDSIDYLLAPDQAENMRRATGVIDSMLPTFRQGTKDWENRFGFVQNALTADKLDMMTGVLSESDIAILKSIAAGGVDLSSGEPAVVNALTNFRDALGGGGSEPTQSGGRFKIVAEE